jgi:hypothetical protein
MAVIGDAVLTREPRSSEEQPHRSRSRSRRLRSACARSSRPPIAAQPRGSSGRSSLRARSIASVVSLSARRSVAAYRRRDRLNVAPQPPGWAGPIRVAVYPPASK